MRIFKLLSILGLSILLIACDSTTYPTIGGKVKGLDGTIVLRNNGGDDLTIKKSGAFTFEG